MVDSSQKLTAFRQALRRFEPINVVQRYITSGGCAMLHEEQYAELKQQVASRFEIHHSDVLVVGSAKLGFSIAPRKRWVFFGDHSDIDVAIVSNRLYLEVWRELAALVEADPLLDWPRRDRFLGYKLHGWIRPDLLPRSPALPRADQWFEFFRTLTASGTCGPYKISAGLYYDMHFLETYQCRAVGDCRMSEGES